MMTASLPRPCNGPAGRVIGRRAGLLGVGPRLAARWAAAACLWAGSGRDRGPRARRGAGQGGRAAQFGVGGGAGVGVGEAAEAGDIARQFDDPLVVDVVQHEIRCPGRRSERPWRLGFIVLYMDRNGGKTARPFAEGGPTSKPG